MSPSFPRWLAAAAALLVPVGLSAQISTATVAGAVHDQSGAPIPGASIKVTNQDTGATAQAVSDGDGSYRLALTPARYRLEIGLDGFEPVVAAGGARRRPARGRRRRR